MSIVKKIRNSALLHWVRKPTAWAHVYESVTWADLVLRFPDIADLPEKSVGGINHPTDDIFTEAELERSIIWRLRVDSQLYLVNTEGYRYARYCIAIVEPVSSQVLKAQLRGDATWNTFECDEPTKTLGVLVRTMRDHGFTVVKGEQGETRVINPHTGNCEVIYKVEAV